MKNCESCVFWQHPKEFDSASKEGCCYRDILTKEGFGAGCVYYSLLQHFCKRWEKIPTPMELEKNIISLDNWSTAPKEIKDYAVELSFENVPTAIGFDDKFGWFILQTAGQGPILVAHLRDYSCKGVVYNYKHLCKGTVCNERN